MTKQITEQEYNQLKEETRDFIKTMLLASREERLVLKGYVLAKMESHSNYDPDERKAG